MKVRISYIAEITEPTISNKHTTKDAARMIANEHKPDGELDAGKLGKYTLTTESVKVETLDAKPKVKEPKPDAADNKAKPDKKPKA